MEQLELPYIPLKVIKKLFHLPSGWIIIQYALLPWITLLNSGIVRYLNKRRFNSDTVKLFVVVWSI